MIKVLENEFDECLLDVLYDFDHIEDNCFCLTQIICDSIELQDLILARINDGKRSFKIFDLSKYQDRSCKWLYAFANAPFIVFGFEEYTRYLQSNFYQGQQNQLCKLDSCSIDMAKVWLYNHAINMLRDSFFAANNVKCIFIFSNFEYNIFSSCALDFCSYSNSIVDFNKTYEKVNK